MNRRTDGRTDGQTDGRTNRLRELDLVITVCIFMLITQLTKLLFCFTLLFYFDITIIGVHCIFLIHKLEFVFDQQHSCKELKQMQIAHSLSCV